MDLSEWLSGLARVLVLGVLDADVRWIADLAFLLLNASICGHTKKLFEIGTAFLNLIWVLCVIQAFKKAF